MLKCRKLEVYLLLITLFFFSNIFIHFIFKASEKQMKLTTMDYDDVFGEITVVSPNNLDLLRINNTFTIKWSAMGGIEYVTIALYRRSEFVDSIAIATENDGFYDWVVGKYEEGKEYSIGIWDYYDFNVHDFSDYFEITSKSIFNSDLIINLFVFVVGLIGMGGIIIVLARKIIFVKKKNTSL